MGRTRGFRRDSRQFYCRDSTPKDIWVRPLRKDAKELLKAPELPEELAEFETPLSAKRAAARLGAAELGSLFRALQELQDPRQTQGRRYPLSCCLAIITCGTLAGCSGVRECAEMAAGLTQPQLRSLRSWRNRKTGRYEAPGATTLWRVAEAVDPDLFEKTVLQWFRAEGRSPEAVALDGKVLKATFLNEDGGSCVVSAMSHQSPPLFSIRSSLIRKGKKSRQRKN